MRLTTRARTRGARGVRGDEAADSTARATSLAARLRRAYVAHALADALPSRRSWALKRALDLAIALPLALLTAPLWLVVALTLWARYRQPPVVTRVCGARGGAPYAVPMFCSAPDAEYHVESHDEIPIEVWPSASRIDRLPAIWSVVSGRLSLVGPAPWALTAYDTAPAEALARLQVAPGHVRLRAVGRLGRLATTAAEADRLYVTHGSLWMDIEQLVAAAFMRRRFFSRGAPPDE